MALTKKQQQRIAFIEEGLEKALAELDKALSGIPAGQKDADVMLNCAEKRAHLILRAAEMKAATFE